MMERGSVVAHLLRPSTAVLMFFRIWISEWLFLQRGRGGHGEGKVKGAG